MRHTFFDQYTQQAESWLRGEISLSGNPHNLEVAEYKGKLYNSFPPTPTFVELLILPIFGHNTPTFLIENLIICFICIVIMRKGVQCGWSPVESLWVAVGVGCGTNLLNSTVSGGVWHQAQILGFVLGTLSLIASMSTNQRLRPWSYFFLSLSVGCRPFYLFMLPLLFVIDKTRGISVRTTIKYFLMYAFPYLVMLALYNFVRFDNPLEFGHKYLPLSMSLEHGEFSVYYLPRNLHLVFLNLPEFKDGRLIFDLWGSAFWINNSILIIFWAYYFASSQPRSLKIVVLISMMLIWSGLLVHQSNGWAQFGYRYIIDLIPLSLFCAFQSHFRPKAWFKSIVAASILINMYGTWWFNQFTTDGFIMLKHSVGTLVRSIT
jgi:hypothetical protein